MNLSKGSVNRPELIQSSWYDIARDAPIIAIGGRNSSVRIVVDDEIISYRGAPTFIKEMPDPDLVALYEYLKQDGRVIYLSCHIARETVKYLKETN